MIIERIMHAKYINIAGLSLAMPDCIIVHYAEIALKGQNRNYFEKKLAKNIKDVMPVGTKIKRHFGRFVVSGTPDKDYAGALARIPGISNFAFAVKCGNDFDSLKAKTIELLDGKLQDKRFKVVASGNGFPLSSSDIERQLGAAIVEKYKIRASMTMPDVTVHVEAFDSTAYIYLEKFQGMDGLPVGSSGRAVVLLSGGIDSPVAAVLAAKRGCRPIFIHFHALRSNEDAENSKIAKIVEMLLPYVLRTKVYYVPYSLFQLGTSHIPPEYELVVFRRFMNRAAEEIAMKEKAKAIVTGESIGQVASQTLDNLISSEDATKLPVIRPLITFDKNEIINLAKKLGTYDLSILDYKDCCSIITKHPKTRPKLEKIKAFEETFDVNKLVQDTINASKVVAYKYGKGRIEAKEIPVPAL